MAFTPEEIAQILEEFFRTVGTRQYVGARYVPIFGRKDEESIEWDNTKPYEPLTIVLYQGNSFTSRQYVPVGVDITNNEFWAITGNYNAQVEQYRRDVASYMEQVDENTRNIATNTRSIEELADYVQAAYVRAFSTVSDMADATDLIVGMVCHTNGASVVGDNGDAWYVIQDSGTADGTTIIACANDLLAHRIIYHVPISTDEIDTITAT